MTEAPARPARPPRQPQQRSVAAPAKGGAKSAAAPEPEEASGGKLAKLGKKKLIMIVVVVLAIAGAAGYFFLMPKKATAKPAPKPGAVVALESTSLNLANGHYLRVGIALQMTSTAASGGEGSEGPDGSKAKDLLISTFSGKTVNTLNNTKERDALKKELVEKISKAYDEEVMDVYFTEFVTQ